MRQTNLGSCLPECSDHTCGLSGSRLGEIGKLLSSFSLDLENLSPGLRCLQNLTACHGPSLAIGQLRLNQLSLIRVDSAMLLTREVSF